MRTKGISKPEPRGTLDEQNTFYAKLQKETRRYNMIAMADRLAFQWQSPKGDMKPLEEARRKSFYL
jgi:hypothetical protein